LKEISTAAKVTTPNQTNPHRRSKLNGTQQAKPKYVTMRASNIKPKYKNYKAKTIQSNIKKKKKPIKQRNTDG
jgi:hypothetical protein